MIKATWKDVYDSVVDAQHTGDVNWQTGLNISGKGKATIIVSTDSDTLEGEIKITLDSNVLINGVPAYLRGPGVCTFVIEWNETLLVEYRTTNVAKVIYIDIYYYNKG